MRRQYLADRKPLREYQTGKGWLWDRNEVAEARKRSMAKRFLALHLEPEILTLIRDFPTTFLVSFCRKLKCGTN